MKVTSAWSWDGVSDWPKLEGMMFAWKPGERYALGLVIDSRMNLSSGSPRFFASPTIAVPRFGPVVPVVPAAARVWQPLHPESSGEHGLAGRDRRPGPAEPELEERPPEPLVAPCWLPSEVPPVGAPAPAPGSPASAALGGVVPIGGGALGFWDDMPGLEGLRRDDMDGGAHQGMTGAAELGALGRVVAQPGRRDAQGRGDPRDGVELLRELGHEEAVDHVKRAELEHGGLTLGQVQRW